MKNRFAILVILIFSISVLACNNQDPDDSVNQIDTPEGYILLWNDEFDGTGIDPAKWNFETGDGTAYGLPAGWGNNERQLYTDAEANAKIDKDGEVSALMITAVKLGATGFTSAKLTTKGLFSMRYGRLDVRAKMPKGQGIWPAIWLLGDNRDQIDWPGCGEIDVMEMLGNAPATMYATVHYTNGQNAKGEIQQMKQLNSGDFSDNYHVFSLEWSPESMKFLLDGEQFQEVPIAEDMKEFQRSFYLIMNVAVGGYWPGNPDLTTPFPQTMYVDYVRAYSKNGFTAPAAPALDISEETLGQFIEPSIADNAIKEGFTDFGGIKIVTYGGGGEPTVSSSTTAIDGDLSLQLNYPGTNWGGAYIEILNTKNLSAYSTLVFSINKPASMVDAEIKLESPITNASVNFQNYTGTPQSNGFVEYRIPLSDFAGLDLSNLKIPFAIWNPTNANGDFIAAQVLIDNLYLDN